MRVQRELVVLMRQPKITMRVQRQPSVLKREKASFFYIEILHKTYDHTAHVVLGIKRQQRALRAQIS